MSPFGLVFPKSVLHSLGARPAIYGLSGSPIIPSGDDGGPRIIPPDSLPLVEQYRYVTFAPGAGINWTHEREWRWAYRGELPDEDDVPPDSGLDIPGLELNRPGMRGLGAVVKTIDQAHRLIYDFLTIADRAGRRTSRYDFVVARELIEDVSVLRDPVRAEEAIAQAAFSLGSYFQQTSTERKRLVGVFQTLVREVSTSPGTAPHGRELGKCWLWLTDNRHPMTRALVAADRVCVNKEGRYLVALPEFSDNLSLSEREEMTRRLARTLAGQFGLTSTYHSVLNGDDPDGVPHYSDPPFENDFHFNYAHRRTDF